MTNRDKRFLFCMGALWALFHVFTLWLLLFQRAPEAFIAALMIDGAIAAGAAVRWAARKIWPQP